jgi:tetratricopeptide (TPR) repeat protein
VSQLLYNIGVGYLSAQTSDNKKSYRQALAAFQRAEQVTKNHAVQATSLTGVGTTLLLQGNSDDASLYLHDAVHRDPRNAYAQVYLGNYYYLQGDYPNARAAYQKAISLAPGFAWAHSNLGTVYFYLDSFPVSARAGGLDQEAGSDLIAVGNKQSTTEISVPEGEKVGSHKRIPGDNILKAVVQWRHALMIDPRFALPHQYLGQTYLQYRSDFEGLGHDPVKRDTDIVLKARDADLGYVVSALSHLQSAVRFDPSDASAYSWLGEAYRRIKDWDSAKFAYMKGHSLDPISPWFIDGYAQILALQGKMPQSREWWSKSLSLWNEKSARHRLFGTLVRNAAGKSLDPVQELRNTLTRDAGSLGRNDLLDAVDEVQIWRELPEGHQPKQASEIEALLNTTIETMVKHGDVASKKSIKR